MYEITIIIIKTFGRKQNHSGSIPKDVKNLHINALRKITQKCRKQDFLFSEKLKVPYIFAQGFLYPVFTGYPVNTDINASINSVDF